MRKRNLDKIFDHILWYTIYLWPIIAYIFACVSDSGGALTEGFFGFVIQTSVNFAENNPIYWCFEQIFGSAGILPLFDAYELGFEINPIFTYLSYFVSVYLCHLMIDFILFIPRLAHKWLKKLYQEE